MSSRQPSFSKSATPTTPAGKAASEQSFASAIDSSLLPHLVQSFLDHGDGLGWSERTLETRRERLAVFGRFIRDSGAACIGVAEIRQFLVYLRHGKAGDVQRVGTQGQALGPVSPGTIKGYHSTLRTFLNWLVEEGEIDAAPTDRVPTPVDRPDQVQPFSEEHLKMLYEAACSPHRKGQRKADPRRDEAIFLVLFDTGMRASELCGLLLSDFDSTTGQILITKGKGGKERRAPLSPKARHALYLYIRGSRKGAVDTEPLFISDGGNTRSDKLTRNGLYQIVVRWGEIAAIGDSVRVSPHTFRHTFAINFLRGGGNVMTLKEMLGHESLAIVTRYVAIAQADIARQHARYSPVAQVFGTKIGRAKRVRNT